MVLSHKMPAKKKNQRNVNHDNKPGPSGTPVLNTESVQINDVQLPHQRLLLDIIESGICQLNPGSYQHPGEMAREVMSYSWDESTGKLYSILTCELCRFRRNERLEFDKLT